MSQEINALDQQNVAQFLRYAKFVAGRGYIHNTLGNMALRVPHEDHAHGVAYTKHAEISLEEMNADNIVITDIPSSRILFGDAITSVGHNLNRKILELRSDINAVIHVHDDDTIAFFASGAFTQIGVVSLDFPFIHGKPAYYVPADIDVEADAKHIEGFIQDTNCLVLIGHGVTTLGRTLSEAYHRMTSFTSEVKRNSMAEQMAALKGTQVQYHSQAQVNRMYRLAERVIYPDRADNVMTEN